jgi:hypothetical protein
VNTSTSTSLTEAPTAAVLKAVQDNANTRAPAARTISTAGLAAGGGDLTANRTITVPVASAAQAQAGTDNATAMTPLRVKNAIDAQSAFTKEKTWDDLAIVGGGTITLNHGLGGAPKFIALAIKCVIAEHSYAVGDVLEAKVDSDPFGSANEGLAVRKTATQLIVKVGANGPSIQTAHYNGQSFIPSPGSWVLQIGAYA